MPGCQPVERDTQQFQVLDLVKLAEVQVGRGFRDFLPYRDDSLRTVVLRRAFRDQERALPIVAAVDHHEQP